MSLKINEEFKKKFNERKDSELLQKLKNKYEDEEESDSEEEVDCPKYTPGMDEAYNNVLEAIKNKNPHLKDSDHDWYEGIDFEAADDKKKKKDEDESTSEDEEYRAFTKQTMVDIIKRYKDKDKKLNNHENDAEEMVDGSEDEKEVEKAELFEYKYDMRYEDQDTEFLVNYPRKIADSVRNKDKKVTNKKQEEKARKEKEKANKKAELKMLKDLKEKDVMKKLRRLQNISGVEMEVDDADLDGDFNPEQHDKMMKKYFGKTYQGEYDIEDVTHVEDKALNSDDGEEDWDNWKGHKPEASAGDDEEDATVDDEVNDKRTRQKKDGRKRKKSKFSEMLSNSKSKPTFNPKIETFDEYLARHYDLDSEDVIDGQKCRFQYKKVYTTDYGLSTEEVLNADDQELEEWMPLKSMTECRADEEEALIEQNVKGKLKKKKKILKSLLTKPEEGEGETSGGVRVNTSHKPTPNKRKRQRSTEDIAGMSDDRLRAYDIEPKKFKYFYAPIIRNKDKK